MAGDDRDEVATLREQVARLERRLAELEPAPPAATSRRLLLRGALAAGGAAAAGLIASGQRVAANDTDPLNVGMLTLSTSPTDAKCNGGISSGAAYLFQAGITATAAALPINAALAGVASNGTTQVGVHGRGDAGSNAIGVYGSTTHSFKAIGVYGYGGTGVLGRPIDATGTGVWGRSTDGSAVYGDSWTGDGVQGFTDSGNGVHGTSTSGAGLRGESTSSMGVHGTGSTGVTGIGTSIGVEAGGTDVGVSAAGAYAVAVWGADTACLRLTNTYNSHAGERPSPRSRTDAHVAGEIDFDANHDLWLCTSAGTPGTWRKLAGTSSAGAFHPVVPARVYDSRTPAPGPIARMTTGATRLVNVAARRDLATGAGVENNYVPDGATAITANVTVVDTVDAGFLTINPGGITTIGAAAVNWFGSGQILNNGVTLTLNAQRELTLIAGGDPGAACHVVIDVTGYYL